MIQFFLESAARGGPIFKPPTRRFPYLRASTASDLDWQHWQAQLRELIENVFGVGQITPIRFGNSFEQRGFVFAAQGEGTLIRN